MKPSWKKIGCAILASMMFAAPFGTVTEAHHHSVAGVDYPYDASDYYAPDRISEPDSAPSRFALRDLATNGGTVYDFIRHQKSILYQLRFVDILAVLQKRFQIDLASLLHLPDSWKNQAQIDIKKIPVATDGGHGITIGDLKDLPVGAPISKMDKLKKRPSLNSDDPSDKPYDVESSEAEKIAQLGQNYEGLFRTSTIFYGSSMDGDNAIQNATQASIEANGAMQTRQAKNDLTAISGSIEGNNTALYAGILEAMSLDGMDYLDKTIRAQESYSHATFSPVNPYDDDVKRAEKESYDYEKPEAPGMPDF